MYIYGIQSDKMHSFHPKHSNLENHCFRYKRQGWAGIPFCLINSLEIPTNLYSKREILLTPDKRPPKSPKIAPKKRSLNRNFLIFLVWYIIYGTWWILMSRRFRICMGKGGKGVFKAELRAAEVDAYFKICRDAISVLRIKVTPPILVRSLWNE